MKLQFPWFTLYGEPNGHRIRCFFAMMWHEILHLVGLDPHNENSFGYASTLRYNIGVPATKMLPGLSGSFLFSVHGEELPTVVDGAYLYSFDGISGGLPYGQLHNTYRGNGGLNIWEQIGSDPQGMLGTGINGYWSTPVPTSVPDSTPTIMALPEFSVGEEVVDQEGVFPEEGDYHIFVTVEPVIPGTPFTAILSINDEPAAYQGNIETVSDDRISLAIAGHLAEGSTLNVVVEQASGDPMDFQISRMVILRAGNGVNSGQRLYLKPDTAETTATHASATNINPTWEMDELKDNHGEELFTVVDGTSIQVSEAGIYTFELSVLAVIGSGDIDPSRLSYGIVSSDDGITRRLNAELFPLGQLDQWQVALKGSWTQWVPAEGEISPVIVVMLDEDTGNWYSNADSFWTVIKVA